MVKRTWHVTLGSPALLSDTETKRLHAYWKKESAAAITKKTDATNPHDPWLANLVTSIRDGYFQIFSEKRFVLTQLERDPKSPVWNQRMEDLDFDLIVHKNQAFKALTTPGFGNFGAKQREHYERIADTFSGPGKPLSDAKAISLMGTIIKQSIDAFESLNKFYHVKKTPRMKVYAQTSMLATPETLGLERHQTRKSWVKSLEASDGPDSGNPR